MNSRRFKPPYDNVANLLADCLKVRVVSQEKNSNRVPRLTAAKEILQSLRNSERAMIPDSQCQSPREELDDSQHRPCFVERQFSTVLTTFSVGGSSDRKCP